MTNYLTQTLQLTGGAELMKELTTNFGYELSVFGVSLTPNYQAIVVAGFTILLLVLNILSGKKLTTVIGEVGKKIKIKKKK
jgi:hypothetical protein